MRKIYAFLVFMFFFGNIFSQDIVVNFQGEMQATGNSVTLDKIVVENLTRGGSVELTDNFTLNLTNMVNIRDVNANYENAFQKVYPNPFSSSLNIEFYSEGNGYSSVLVYNLTGQIVASLTQQFDKGVNKCVFTPKEAGIYFISLNDNGRVYTSKAISTQKTNSVAKLTYQGIVATNRNLQKSSKSNFFEEGDILRFTATADDLTSVIYDSPSESKTYTFEFAERFLRFEKYYMGTNIPNFVDVMFTVIDQDYKGVDFLTNDDFVVLEDGSTISPSESFRYVKKIDQIPYSQKKVVIMLDNSQSLADDLDQVKSAAITLVNQLAGEKQIAVYSFSDNVELLQDFTSNVTDLENAINGITLGFPSTNLYGALIEGLNHFQTSYSLDAITEEILIALTDGDDTQGSHSLQDVIDARGIKKVFMVGLGDEINSDNLNQISYPGNYIAVSDVSDLEQTFKQIQYDIARLANSFYWVTYMSPKRTGTHTLQVGASDNNNAGSDMYLSGSFNADSFQSVYSGVYINIDTDNLYGVDTIDCGYVYQPQLKATTYWANNPPSYTWTTNNDAIASIQVDPNDNSKAVVVSHINHNDTAVFTVTDVVNNYSKNVNIKIFPIFPVVNTLDITNISITTATCKGEVVSEEEVTVTSRGICWSTSENPTIGDSYSECGSGTGTFSVSIGGLTENTTYYVRAYATNSYGTAYGEQKTFTTNDFIYVTDYDGNTYRAVQIGNQVWMAENLKVTHYPDGTAIPHITDDTQWENLGDNNTDDAYCYYNNNANGEKDIYGALYTWAAAMGDNAVSSNTNPSGVQGVCPDGWHLPSDAEWIELTDYLGGEDVAGGKLKEAGITHWDSPNTGATNESEFSALPGGGRNSSGGFYDSGLNGDWWSASECAGSYAWGRYLYSHYANIDRNGYNKSYGFSVRCVRD